MPGRGEREEERRKSSKAKETRLEPMYYPRVQRERGRASTARKRERERERKTRSENRKKKKRGPEKIWLQIKYKGKRVK